MTERISAAEYEVMEVLWAADKPLTATEVSKRVSAAKPWHERTVKTLLGRLLAKGALTHDIIGRRYRYRPAIARDVYVLSESKRLVERLFEGRLTPLIAAFAEQEELTPEDIAELRDLLKELEND